MLSFLGFMNGKRVEETVHVYEFIRRLSKHIPDKNFKVVKITINPLLI